MTSLCFVILLLSIFQLSYCVVVLNGYKVVQYDEGTPFGSRVSYANLLAISKNTDIPNLNRYMVLIEAKDLNAQVLQEVKLIFHKDHLSFFNFNFVYSHVTNNF